MKQEYTLALTNNLNKLTKTIKSAIPNQPQLESIWNIHIG